MHLPIFLRLFSPSISCHFSRYHWRGNQSEHHSIFKWKYVNQHPKPSILAAQPPNKSRYCTRTNKIKFVIGCYCVWYIQYLTIFNIYRGHSSLLSLKIWLCLSSIADTDSPSSPSWLGIIPLPNRQSQAECWSHRLFFPCCSLLEAFPFRWADSLVTDCCCSTGKEGTLSLKFWKRFTDILPESHPGAIAAVK